MTEECEMTVVKEMNIYGSDVAELCKKTNTWYSEDFIISFYADGNWSDKPEQTRTILKMSKSFANKWGFVNVIPEPYEDEFQIYDSQTLTSKQLPEFIQDAQTIIDYAWDANASILVNATFMPEDGQKDKSLVLYIDDESKMAVKCETINIRP